MKNSINIEELKQYIVDGREANMGRGVRGSNGSFSRHALTMMILGKNPSISFTELKLHKDRKNYWRVSDYLRDKTQSYTLLK